MPYAEYRLEDFFWKLALAQVNCSIVGYAYQEFIFNRFRKGKS